MEGGPARPLQLPASAALPPPTSPEQEFQLGSVSVAGRRGQTGKQGGLGGRGLRGK